MSFPLLAIEAGNSRLKFGLFVPAISSFYQRMDDRVTKVAEVKAEWPSCHRFVAIPVNDEIPWEILANYPQLLLLLIVLLVDFPQLPPSSYLPEYCKFPPSIPPANFQ